MNALLTEISFDQLPDAHGLDAWVSLLLAFFTIVVLLASGVGFLASRHDKLEEKAEEKSHDPRWVKKRFRPFIVVTSVLFLGASAGVITFCVMVQSNTAAEQKVIDAANVKTRETVRAEIETSLLDSYLVESVHPLAGETPYSNVRDSSSETAWPYDGTDSDGVWGADWIRLSLKNDPLIAPQADVVIADGNIVTWGITVDGKTGVARFVNRASGSTTAISPSDVARDAATTSVQEAPGE